MVNAPSPARSKVHPAAPRVTDNTFVPELMEPITLNWVLAAKEPEHLARFYASLLELKASRGLSSHHWRLMIPGGTTLEIYRPSRHRPFPDRGRALAPCLRHSPHQDPLATLLEWLARAQDLGAVVEEEPRLESFGAEAWLNDPEGNALLLLVPVKAAPNRR